MSEFILSGNSQWSYVEKDGHVIAAFNHEQVPADAAATLLHSLMGEEDTIEAAK